MKKVFFILVLALGFALPDFAQMSLVHHFSGNYNTEIADVNLSRSGRKILTMRSQANYPGSPDTIFFYNPDYSFWKMIPCPHYPGYIGYYNFYKELGVGVFYPSETLFNNDTLLEVAFFHYDSAGTSPRRGILLIVNEHGQITDSIPNLYYNYISSFKVKSDTSGVFYATVCTINGPEVYRLPGTLPCESCVISRLETAALSQPKSIISQPIPNPSKEYVKITFSLPDGVNLAWLNVYDINGRLVKNYKVDNKFGFILLDNSQLAAGTYMYNIVVDGAISSTQKFVVVR